MTAAVRDARAVRDGALSARVVRRTPLLYAAGAAPAQDRPAHVRAGSGLAWVRARLAVVQDDAAFVALVDPASGEAHAVTLPRGPGGVRQFDDVRGNKADKLDLESLVRVPDDGGATLLLALGSGSTDRRERVVTLRVPPDGRGPVVVDVRPATAFYAALRAEPAFAGSELNVEGAVWRDDGAGGRLRLFNRGNGAPHGALAPVNATCDVSWPALAAYLAESRDAAPPSPRDVVRWDLGALAGCPLTFTDAALPPAAARRLTLYLAAAEASPDAVRDGPLAGCAVGVIDEAALGGRWALLVDPDGRPFDGKVEGLAPDPRDPSRVWVVLDRDVPDVPSELCEVALDGPWLAGGAGSGR